jgi:predicted TIM-barrel fold metal-dependent hydrolase
VFEAWRKELVALARCENVYVKLGGRTMTMAGFGWHRGEAPPGSAELAEAVGPYYRTCIELFGADRCMFESNFPVDRASCSYTVLWNAFKRLSSEYSPAERAALFHDTAVRVYRLNKLS